MSGQLDSINIYRRNYILYIDIDVSLLYAARNCRITFVDVQEYLFYHTADRYFYNIERFKFFKSGELFYISLDPFEEDLSVDERDQDFVLSRGVEGFFL